MDGFKTTLAAIFSLPCLLSVAGLPHLAAPAAYANFPRQVSKVATYDCGAFDVELYRQANGSNMSQRVMMAIPKCANPNSQPSTSPCIIVPFYFPEAMLGLDPATGGLVSPFQLPGTNLTYYAPVRFMGDLVRRGCIVISADAYHLSYPYRDEPADWTPERRTQEHAKEPYAAWKKAAAALNEDWPDWSGIGKLTFDTRLLVDFAAADARVDAKRIGMMGHSLGGKMAFYAGCLDPRVKVVVASDFGLGWTQTNWDAPWYWGDKLKRVRAMGFSHADLLSRSGAKPFCLLAGEADDADSGVIMRAAKGYETCPERLKFIHHGTGHRPPPSAVEEGYRFLDRYL